MKSIIVGMLTCLSSLTLAAPQQNIDGRAAVMPNDGFVTAYQAKNNGPVIKVCPPKTDTIERNQCILERHAFKPDVIVDSITAQEFLDQKFGVGVTEYDGIGPGGTVLVIIYYRIKN